MVSEPVDEPLALPKRNTWGDYVLTPLLLTVMISCVSLSLIALGRAIIPAWWGGHLLLGMVLATIEAIYSFRILTNPKSRGISIARYRLAELGTLAILLKIVTYVGQPWAEIWPSLALMLRQPGHFFSGDYILMLTLALLAWAFTYSTMVNFEALYDPLTFRSDRVPAMDKIAVRFFWGGGLIVVMSGLSLIASEDGILTGLSNLTKLDRPSIGGLVLNALIYFSLGLVMLSQVRLTSLLTRWHIQRVTVAGGLGRRWAKYGLIFLLIIGVLVIFLPTGYSIGLFHSAQYLFAFLAQAALVIAQLLILLIAIPFNWLISLFSTDSAPPPAMSGGIGPPPTLPPPMAGQAPAWGEIVRSLIFWLVFAAIAIYLIRSYLADRPELLASLKRFTPLRWLFGVLATLFVWLVQFIRSGAELIPKRTKQQPAATPSAPKPKRRRLFRFGATSEREQILRYYLTTLQQAQEAGVIRRKDQTPYEFEPQLSDSVPDVEAEVDLLTKAFVHARYSAAEFDSEQASLVKTVWEKVRAALKTKQQQDQELNAEQ